MLRGELAKKKWNMKAVILFFVSIGICSTAMSADWQWSPYVSVSNVYPAAEGLIVIPAGFTNPSNACPTYFLIGLNDVNYQVKVASMLMAFAAGKTVAFAYDRSVTACESPIDRFVVQQ